MHPGQQVFIAGSGFSLENTVWFGAQAVAAQLVLSGGAVLQLEVPASLAPGTYKLYVTIADAKSNALDATVE